MRQQVRIVAHRNKSGRISVRLRCTLGGRECDIATGVVVDAREWDARRQRVSTANANHAALNAEVDNVTDKAVRWIAAHPDRSVGELKLAFSPPEALSGVKGYKYTDNDFYAAYGRFMAQESLRNGWSAGTLRRFQSLFNSLNAFEPLLTFDKVDAATLDRYVAHLAAQGNKTTTAAKSVSLLRWFLRWAAAEGLYHGDAADYRPKLHGARFEFKEIVFLTLDELRKVESAELPPSQSRVRDVFIFCCYTGLRFSDAAKLTRSDVHGDVIEIVTAKTNDRLRIELNAHSRAIIDRYAGMDFPKDRALPVISNQRTNDILKDIGQRCGITAPVRVVYYVGNVRHEEVVEKYKALTTHCARRTFVVTALYLGIPLEVISRWTGHHDLAAMKPYVAIVDELKARSMAKFDEL